VVLVLVDRLGGEAHQVVPGAVEAEVVVAERGQQQHQHHLRAAEHADPAQYVLPRPAGQLAPEQYHAGERGYQQQPEQQDQPIAGEGHAAVCLVRLDRRA
jgi:hypothetical protein